MLWIYLLSDMVKYRGRTWNGRVFHPECALHFSGVYLHLQAKSSGFINFIRDGAWIVDSGGQESQQWVSWLWWSLVDVEISPTKIYQNHKSQSKTKSNTNLRNGWNWAKNLWRFQVGSLSNRVFVWVNRISCGRNQGLQEQIPVILHWFTVMGQHTALVQRWGNFSSSFRCFRPLMSLMLMVMVKFLFQSFVWCSQATSCVGRVKDVKMRWLKQTKRKGRGNGWSLVGKIGWNKAVRT